MTATNPVVTDTEWIGTDDGARLHVSGYGAPDLPTVVLSHGWACNTDYWRPQIEALAGRYRVVAYDQRGHGLSTPGGRPIDAAVLADDLASVIDHLAVQPSRRVLAVGHSMGGVALQSWWQRHPDQARRTSGAMILANTTQGGLVRGTRIFPFLNGRVAAPERLGRLALGAPLPLPGGPLATWVVRRRVMNPKVASREQARFVAGVTRSCPAVVRARTALALADVDLAAEGLAAVAVPTTVTVGRVDRLTPAWMGRAIADELERHGRLDRLVEFDTGHAGNIESADAFNREIERMVRTHLQG